jgi:hypothetical protein
MSKTPIIIGVVVLLLVVIGVVMYFTMTKGEEPVAVAPSAGPSTGTAVALVMAPAGPPKGRYVKLEQTVAYDESAGANADDRNKVINLAELEVFDVSGTNLAAGKTVTGSSEYSATHGYMNLTDGNKANFAHTKGRTEEEIDYLQVDLGTEKEIKKLVITNRTTCCTNRAIGIKAVILAADGTTVVKETPIISTEAGTYTIEFPGNTWS